MAFNAGFAQVTVTPNFSGFQNKVRREMGQTLPPEAGRAGQEAGREFDERFTRENDGKKHGRRFGGAFVGSLKSALAPVAAVLTVAGVGRLFTSAITEASNLEEAGNAVAVSFGENAKKVERLGEVSAKQFGLSKAEFYGIAVQFSATAEQIAGDGGDVAGVIDDLTSRGADFASVMNLDVNEAMSLFQSGLAGETEPLRKYGIDLSAANVEQYALANGIWDGTGAMTEQQKVMARHGSLIEQTNKVEGDFVNTQNSLANAQRVLKANWSDLKGEIGQAFLPVMARATAYVRDEVLPAIRSFKDWVVENREAITLWASVIGGAVTALGGFLLVQKVIGLFAVMKAGLGGLTVAQWALNAAMAANPIGIIVVAIGALVAGLIWAYNNVEGFRNIVDGAWSVIRSAISTAWENFIKPAFQAINSFIQDKLIPVIEWLWKNVVEPAFKGISFAVEVAWNVIKLIFDLWKFAIEKFIAPVIEWLWNKIIEPVFSSIGSHISWVWDNVIKPVFDALGSWINDHIAPAFEEGRDRIKEIWDGLRKIAAEPINFIIDTVYNNGIKAVFDKVAEAVNSDARLPKMDKIPEYAKGGLHKGGWALVGEEGPELVNFSQPGRVYTAKETEALLAAMAGSSPKDALLPMGGFWDNVGSAVSRVGSGVRSAFSSVGSWIRGSLASLAETVLAPVREGINSVLQGDGLAGLARGAALKGITNLVSWIRGKDAEEIATGSFDGALGSFFRPSRGPITSLFGPRWGGFHAGVDIAGGGPTYAAWNGLVQKTGWNVLRGRTGLGILIDHGNGLQTYYGHNPVGGIQVKPGQKVNAGQHIGYQGATGNVTGVHVHFETLRNGKAVNPSLYDEGGWLQPGLSNVANLTRQPEAILTSGQWADIHRLAIGGGGQDVYNVSVAIDPSDLAGLRSIEEFTSMIQRRTRQAGGSR